jgi:HK97 gp10 family phage protein
MAIGNSGTVKMEGWEELKATMKDLGQKGVRAVVKQSLESSAKIVVEAAKGTNAFKDMTGNLRSSIKLKRRKAERNMVGPDVAAESPHAHLQEFGWQQRTAAGSKQIPGTYFLTNALLENQEEVLTKLNSEMKRFIDRRLKRLAKKK